MQIIRQGLMALLVAVLVTACGGSGKSGSKNSSSQFISSASISSSVSSQSSSIVSSESVSSSSAPPVFEVSVSATEGGALAPAGASVVQGESLSLEVVADEHFVLADISGCSGLLTENTYVIEAVTADCVVEPVFEKKIYQVQVVASEGGSVTPLESSVVAGESVVFQLRANSHFDVGEVEGCPGMLAGSEYRIDALWADCVLNVSFDPVVGKPSLSLQLVAPKKFVFTWSAVPNAQQYRLMENIDGKSGYSLVKNLTANLRRHELSVGLHQKIEASYVLEACDASGKCRASNPVKVPDDISSAVTRLSTDSLMLTALALSRDGRFMALGFEFDDSGAVGINGPSDVPDIDQAGSVHVYEKRNSTWTRVAVIKHAEPSERQKFGRSLAFNADASVLAVGTEGVYGAAPSVGAAYVFTRSGNSWQQTAEILPEFTEDWLQFASELALSDDGKTLVVGAVYDSGTPDNPGAVVVPSSGAAHVYKFNGSDWVKTAYIKAANPEEYEAMGSSISLSANGKVLAMVNSPYPDTGVQLRARVFAEQGNTWVEEANLPLGVEGYPGYRQGIVLSRDGSRLVVSNVSDQTDYPLLTGGVVHIFKRGASAWQEEAKLKTPYADCVYGGGLGDSLAMNGPGDLVVASDSCDGHGPTVFVRQGTQWHQKGYLPYHWSITGMAMDATGDQLMVFKYSEVSAY